MLPGTCLGHYRIIGPLGKGGMGEVFAAEDTRLKRKVAIKVLPAAVANDPERRKRLEREAQAIAALNHPSIVTIHSVEDVGGTLFMTMEAVEGETLRDLVARGPLPIDRLLTVCVAITDALAAAHQMGITHRDLKPANVMVTPAARVKVLDFGLARVDPLEQPAGPGDSTTLLNDGLTGVGRIAGTVAYMSPEQAEGRAIDQRSDIFSFGIMLHELATGERPFKGDSDLSVLSAILKETPSSVTDINPKLPEGLARIVRRCLAKQPDRRYQTALDIRNDLEELRERLTTKTTGKDDHSRVAGIVGAAVVSLVLGWTAFVLSRNGKDEAELRIDKLTRLTRSGQEDIAALSPDARYFAHVINRVGESTLAVRQTGGSNDIEIVPPAPVYYAGVSYSPDGDFIYYVTKPIDTGRGTLYRIPSLGGVPQAIVSDVDTKVTFSPDGEYFAFVRGFPSDGTSSLELVETRSKAVKRLSLLAPPDRFMTLGLAWSADGTTIIVPAETTSGSRHRFLVTVDAKTGNTSRIAGEWLSISDLDRLPPSDSVVIAAADTDLKAHQLWVVSPGTGERRRLTNDLNNYSTVSVSVDGKALAAVQAETVASVWLTDPDKLGGGREVTDSRAANGTTGLAWIGNERVVFGSNTSGISQLWMVDATGANLRQITAHDEPSAAPAVPHDGTMIAFHRGRGSATDLWIMKADGSGERQLTHSRTARNPVVGGDGFVYYTEVATGRPKPFKVPIRGGAPVALGEVEFQPQDISVDGKELVGIVWDEAEGRAAGATMLTGGSPPRLIPKISSIALRWGRYPRSIIFGVPGRAESHLYEAVPGVVEPKLIGTVPGGGYAHSWTLDRKHVALSYGQVLSDVVLMTTGGK